MGSTKKSKRARSVSESSVERNCKGSKGQKKRKHSESVNESDSDLQYKKDKKLQKKVDKQRKITAKYAAYSDGSVNSSNEEKTRSSRKGKGNFENRSEKSVYKSHDDERSRSLCDKEKHKQRRRSMSVESFKNSRNSYKLSGGKGKVESGYKTSKSSQDYEAEVKYLSNKSYKDHKNEVFGDLTSEAYRNYKVKNNHDGHDESSQKHKFSDNKHRKERDSKNALKKHDNLSDNSENDTSYKKSERHKQKTDDYVGKSENEKNESYKHRESKKVLKEDRSHRDTEELSYIDRRRESDNDSDFKDQQFESSEKYGRYWDNKTDKERNSTENWSQHPENKNRTEHKVGPRYYNVSVDEAKNKESEQGNKDFEVKDKSENISNAEGKAETVTPAQKKTVDLLTSKTGGAYIPPAKLRMMQANITDKSSAAYQRIAWEALKKSIQGHVNKVNISNIRTIVKELQKENIVRGRGLLCRSIIQAQAASPTFTHVYAAFVCAINSKFPNIGELLLKRLVVQFRRGFKRNDKTICISAANFVAHLVNQQVAHEILALQILTLLIENPTDDSVEVAISFLKECGMKLTEVSNKGISAIFDMLRNILHEGSLDKRVQYMIEVMFQIRKDDFKAHPALLEELDIVPEESKIMHIITLEDNNDPQDILNVFKFDPDYQQNEEKYKSLIDEESSDESGESDGSEGSSEEGSDEDEEESNGNVIVDRTETNLVILRRTIYLTIQSSLDFEECAHKLLRMQLKPGQEIEICHMFLDCCAEQRTYEKFFGLLAQRFCQINRSYIGPFEETFRDTYSTVHRVDTDKLRNIAKLFAHLFYTDAISWEVLSTIRLNEDDTTSSSRIFIKILFLELSEYMGLAKLNQRVKDPTLQTALDGLFPRDNPKNTRFAINFFTSIGLGGLTDELREHLKAQPKANAAVPQLVETLSVSSESSSSDSSSSSSTSSSESSSEDSSSTDSSSDSEDSTVRKRSTKKKKQVQKNSKKSSEKKRGTDNRKIKTSKQRKKKII